MIGRREGTNKTSAGHCTTPRQKKNGPCKIPRTGRSNYLDFLESSSRTVKKSETSRLDYLQPQPEATGAGAAQPQPEVAAPQPEAAGAATAT